MEKIRVVDLEGKPQLLECRNTVMGRHSLKDLLKLMVVDKSYHLIQDAASEKDSEQGMTKVHLSHVMLERFFTVREFCLNPEDFDKVNHFLETFNIPYRVTVVDVEE